MDVVIYAAPARPLPGSSVSQGCDGEACVDPAIAMTEAGLLRHIHLAALEVADGVHTDLRQACWATDHQGRWLGTPILAPLVDLP
jgi:hypothetical protein